MIEVLVLVESFSLQSCFTVSLYRWYIITCNENLETNIFHLTQLLHIYFLGSYDFSIMVFGFLSTLENNKDDDNSNNEEGVMLMYSVCAFVVSVLFVIGGALYYSRESKAQKIRLEQIDAARNFGGVNV